MHLLGLDINKENKDTFIKCLSRKKEFIYEEEGELKRALGLHDLLFLGVGSMLGMGVYIMAGDLAGKVGPALCISFVIAGIAASLSGLCYAEFAARIPATGSAYVYCYITIGEFIAFLLGWNLCLEFFIGTATLVRGMSGYIDSLFHNVISTWEHDHFPFYENFMSPYPDFLAFLLMFGFTAIVSVGVQESAFVHNCFVLINLTTALALIVIGLWHISPSNWEIPAGKDTGTGGFMPFGFKSVVEAAASCFYAYTGFDTVASTGGEAKKPHRTIPLALTLSILLAVLVYTALSVTFTLMWPFYDPALKGSPYTYILGELELNFLKGAVAFGALAAVTGCTLASTFGLARIVYAIAVDGLLFKFLAKVNSFTRTPVKASIVSGLFTGCLGAMFTTEQLIDMTSLGTLMAYSMVAVCVLLLRYQDKEVDSLYTLKTKHKYSRSLRQLFNLEYYYDIPNELTIKIAKYGIYSIVIFSVGLACTLVFGGRRIEDLEVSVLVLSGFFFFCVVTSCIVVGSQPKSTIKLSFKVWPVPLLPTVSICINLYLMLNLNTWTWIRFAVWLFIGLIIYFSYGIRHSKENIESRREEDLYQRNEY